MMQDPIVRFRELLDRAVASTVPEPTAMSLATADAEGRPSVRMVLLKAVDERGFTFYTNLESRKAWELAENPWAALCFHWYPLEAQVRVEGSVSRVDDEEADAYFLSRPRGSQVGAWASLQSQPLLSFSELEGRIVEIEARFADRPMTRPPFWSGFRVVPSRIEFWHGRPNRLHQRELYTRTGTGDWSIRMLYP